MNYKVITSIKTDPGCCRETNEDSITYVVPSSEKLLRSKGLLAVVADGMGGHQGGEIASRKAIDIIRCVYYQSDKEPQLALTEAFQQANCAIYTLANQKSDLNGMGTTCTALVFHNQEAFIAHVGDSRLYLLRDNQIYLMTEDHSEVRELVRRGIIRQQQAKTHPNKNVILRALGTRPTVEISFWPNPFPICLGDKFLLCSDGLYELVNDEEIKQSLILSDIHIASSSLVEKAKQRGGYDNITVAIFAVNDHKASLVPTVKITRDFTLQIKQ
jgi:PPM family protein phosphatase